MKTLELKVQIGSDHHVEIEIPRDFPTGPARLHLESESSETESRVPLVASGMLRDGSWQVPEDSDPVAEALADLRRERGLHLEASMEDLSSPEPRR